MTGPVCARTHPSAVGQRLQMAADGRLRKLHDSTKLRDGELMSVQQQEEAAAGRIRQRGEMIVDGRGGLTQGDLIYPLIRMEGLNVRIPWGVKLGRFAR